MTSVIVTPATDAKPPAAPGSEIFTPAMAASPSASGGMSPDPGAAPAGGVASVGGTRGTGFWGAAGAIAAGLPAGAGDFSVTADGLPSFGPAPFAGVGDCSAPLGAALATRTGASLAGVGGFFTGLAAAFAGPGGALAGGPGALAAVLAGGFAGGVFLAGAAVPGAMTLPPPWNRKASLKHATSPPPSGSRSAGRP